jgi:hypothetical protein
MNIAPWDRNKFSPSAASGSTDRAPSSAKIATPSPAPQTKSTVNRWVDGDTITDLKSLFSFIHLNNFTPWLVARNKWILNVWEALVKEVHVGTANSASEDFDNYFVFDQSGVDYRLHAGDTWLRNDHCTHAIHSDFIATKATSHHRQPGQYR